MKKILSQREIEKIRDLLGDEEMYKTVKSVVCPVEADMNLSWFRAETGFIEVMKILYDIRKDKLAKEDVQTLWHETVNDILNIETSADKKAVKDAVNMIFLFVAGALMRSNWPKYNLYMAKAFTVAAANGAECMTDTYNKIIDLTFPECWFDYFTRGEYEELDNKFAHMQQNILQETDKDKITAQNIYFIDKQENHNCQQFPGSIHDSSFITKQ